jgi:hypothetical protein
MYWCVHVRIIPGVSAKREVSPVYVILYVKFTNERDSPMFVDGFSVETKTPNGNWERMPIFDVRPESGTVNFYVAPFTQTAPDFQHANRLDFHDNFLQSRLSEKSLNPHEPVQGWLMLDIPKDGWTHKMRFVIASAGEIITEPLIFDIPKGNKMDIQTVKQLSEFQLMEEQDISGLPIRYYGDGVTPIPK